MRAKRLDSVHSWFASGPRGNRVQSRGRGVGSGTFDNPCVNGRGTYAVALQVPQRLAGCSLFSVRLGRTSSPPVSAGAKSRKRNGPLVTGRQTAGAAAGSPPRREHLRSLLRDRAVLRRERDGRRVAHLADRSVRTREPAVEARPGRGRVDRDRERRLRVSAVRL